MSVTAFLDASSSELVCSQSFNLNTILSHTILFNSLRRMTIVHYHHAKLRLLFHSSLSVSASSRMSQHHRVKANVVDINVDDMDRDTVTYEARTRHRSAASRVEDAPDTQTGATPVQRGVRCRRRRRTRLDARNT